jgi:hypothetical protein
MTPEEARTAASANDAGMSVADRAFVILSVFYKWYAARDDEFVSPLNRP